LGAGTIVALSNPWRDEMGRFAEKGYTASSGEGVRWQKNDDGDVEWYDPMTDSWTSEFWAQQHYGSIETALQMTSAEREAVVTELGSQTVGDLLYPEETDEHYGYDVLGEVFWDGVNGPAIYNEGNPDIPLTDRFGETVAEQYTSLMKQARMRPAYDEKDVENAIEKLTLGQAMQLSAAIQLTSNRLRATGETDPRYSEIRSKATEIDYAVAVTIDNANYRRDDPNPGADLSEQFLRDWNISVESAAATFFQDGWITSSTSMRSQILQKASAKLNDTPKESTRVFDGFIRGNPSRPFNDVAYDTLDSAIGQSASSVVGASQRLTGDILGGGTTTLYRGTAANHENGWSSGVTNPLTAWATTPAVAAEFASMNGGEVYQASFDNSQIVGFAGIGFGHNLQSEHVVAGGKHDLTPVSDWRDEIEWAVSVRGRVDSTSVYLDGEKFGGPDWIKAVAAADVPDVALTMNSPVAFANTWRDEIGRFAEKGYTASSGEGTRYQFGDNRHWSEPLVNVSYSHENEDGEQEWVSDDWALKHYGAIETSFEMTESEREALRAELDNMTAEQFAEHQTGRVRYKADWYDEMTAGQAMQLRAMEEFQRNGLPSHGGDRDGWNSREYEAMLDDFKSGKISADEWSDRVASEYGVTIESAAVSWVHEQWAASSSYPASVAAMRSVSDRHGLDASMGQYEDWLSSRTGSTRLQRSTVVSKELGGTIDAVTGSTYRKTQQMLSEANIDGLTLHRGVTAKDKYSDLQVDGTLTTNPLSSWSSNESVAIDFATTYQSPDDNGVVVSSSIENSDVWGFSGIGAGSSEEAEFILLGNDVAIRSVEHAGTDFAVDSRDAVYIDDTQYGGPDWIKKAGHTRNA
jgi:hypothetical protein